MVILEGQSFYLYSAVQSLVLPARYRSVSKTGFELLFREVLEPLILEPQK
jgi:hypothetical protein